MEDISAKDKRNNTWVFCCGMMRSGSTLQYQLTAALVEKLGLGKRVRHVAEDDFPTIFDEYDDTDGYFVHKCHRLTEPIELLLKENNALSIGIYRDIRDVAISMMRMLNLDFDELLEQRQLENAIEMSLAWSQLPGHLLSKYEEMVPDLVYELQRIASHLHLDYGSLNLEAIAKEFSLDKQIERVKRINEQKEAENVDGVYWDPESLLHYNHIFSGAAGEWKSLLTESQIRSLEERFGDWLLEHNYQLLTKPKRQYSFQFLDQIDDLRRQNDHLLNQINELTQSITLQKDQSMNFSDVQITDLQNNELKDMAKENKDLLRKIEGKEIELQALYHSKSFQLTKPLRILFATVRKIGTHLRRRES